MPKTGMYRLWLGDPDRVGRKNWVSVCVGVGVQATMKKTGDVQTQTGSTSNRI